MIEGLIQALRLITDGVLELANSGDINERDASDAKSYLWEARGILDTVSDALGNLQKDLGDK